jgi:DNA segregation ATPase FtsK/SpoIIIE-like protein
MALRDILDRQANSIEYVLHIHGIRGQVDGGKMSPRLTHFHIMLPPGVRPAQLTSLVPEIADALGVVSCRLAPNDEGVYLEVPRPDPVPVRLLPLVQRVADVVPPFTATLGLDTDSTPLLLRLNSPDVDPVIVAGNPGAGKSNLLRGMALSLALHNSPQRMGLLLLSGAADGSAFRGLDGLPHLACPVARGPVNSLVSLRWALRTLTRRAHLSERDELSFDGDDMGEDERLFEYSGQAEEPVLVIMVDGADELCSTGNRRADAEALDALNRLLAEGRRHNIHMVVSAQQLDRLGDVRWSARISGWVSSPEAARLATGIKGSGAHGLLGAGDFLITLNAELIRFQAAGASEGEVRKAVDYLLSHTQAPSQAYGEEGMVPATRSRSGKPERHVEEPIQLRRNWSGE